jgi:hypothetical protein
MIMNWWTGVVEDRDDPEKLGRCRVRIFGWHTDDTRALPANELPWALPMQSVTSAAASGVGSTPIGIVTGSWVVGFFLDGDEGQQPVIMGTIAGKPSSNADALEKQQQENTSQNYIKDQTGKPIYDQLGNAISSNDDILSEQNKLKPLKAQDLTAIFAALGSELSNNNYSKIGDGGELGKYQFSASALIDLGYVKRPAGGIITSTILDNSALWSNLNGVKSKADFLSNTAEQETAMFSNTQNNYDTLVRLGKIKETDDYKVVGGLIASAHVMGAKNADKLDKKDIAGQRAEKYFTLGNTTLGGDATEFIRQYQEAGNYLPQTSTLNNEDLAKIRGFSDPNKKYPKYEYTGLSDINKLAVSDRSHLSFQVKENKRIEKIPLARTDQTWDEPEPAYGAAYPYNQVIETEAGHVIEIDSTPNAERLHIFHKAGTYIEIDVNGSMIRKVVGENYEIMDRNNFVYVKGAQCLTVEGKTSILVKDNAQIEVEGDLSVTGHGDALVQAAGSMAVIAESAIITAKNSLDIVTEGSLNIQGKSISLSSTGGDINIQSNKDINLQTSKTGTLSLAGGLSMLIDALSIKTKMGANSIKALALSVLTPPDKKTPTTTPIPVLQRKAVNDDSFLFDAGESGAGAYRNKRARAGDISNNISLQPNAEDLNSLNSKSIGSRSVSQASCDACNQFNNSFPRSFKLSSNFTLGHLLVGKYGVALQAQRGLKQKDIVCNLIQLAENCLEPIKAKYPDMQISSGFRIGSTASDHNIGGAADIIFPNRNISTIKDIAAWIVQNVPHRQCLLEYETYSGTDKIRVAWIHISFLSRNGYLVESSYPPVQTFVNHQSIYSKLVNLA